MLCSALAFKGERRKGGLKDRCTSWKRIVIHIHDFMNLWIYRTYQGTLLELLIEE